VNGNKNYVVDTSYLDELYKIPKKHSSTASATVNAKFTEAVKMKARLYVPFPVIFELANHIAHIKDGNERIKKAGQLRNAVASSIKESQPWIIPSASEDSYLLQLDQFQNLCQQFATSFAKQGIGMTDLSIIHEARRLKQRALAIGSQTHIWTLDKALKRHEPDPEPNPFTG